MSPYEPRSLPRRPLAVLPLEPFLVRNRASSSAPGKPSPPARPLPLQLRDMSLLPSPFLAASTSTSTSTAAPTARPAARPLATLYEASSEPSRDASSSLRSSPKARLMMQEDDVQAHSLRAHASGRREDDDDDLELGSSPRRLYDAFVAVANRSPTEPSPRLRKKSSTSSLSAAHFVTERSQMPPPPSPRRTGSPRVARVLARPEDEALPNWSFYQDDDEDEASSDTAMSIQAANEGPVPASSPAGSSLSVDGSEEATPIDKENAAPAKIGTRSRSSSLLAAWNTSTAPAPPAAAPTPSGTTTPPFPHAPSTSASDAAPCTPPRPISPPLPLLSPPILDTVDAPSAFGDTGVTSFFAAATHSSLVVTGEAVGATARLETSTVVFAGEEIATTLPLHPDGNHGVPRKKRRSGEAGRSIAID
ncbi:hypothetical protein JCM3774_000231 [Rhodotorula dairenensis]